MTIEKRSTVFFFRETIAVSAYFFVLFCLVLFCFVFIMTECLDKQPTDVKTFVHVCSLCSWSNNKPAKTLFGHPEWEGKRTKELTLETPRDSLIIERCHGSGNFFQAFIGKKVTITCRKFDSPSNENIIQSQTLSKSSFNKRGLDQ